VRSEKVRQAELTPTKTLVNAQWLQRKKKKLKNSEKKVGE
jgi:hypothetical protein